MNLGHTVQFLTSSVCSGDRKSAGVAKAGRAKASQRAAAGGEVRPHILFYVSSSMPGTAKLSSFHDFSALFNVSYSQWFLSGLYIAPI